MASNTAAALTPRPRSSSIRRCFSARQMAHRAATSARWSTRSAPGATAARRARAVTPTWPSTGTVTGWNRPRAIGSKSTWTIGL